MKGLLAFNIKIDYSGAFMDNRNEWQKPAAHSTRPRAARWLGMDDKGTISAFFAVVMGGMLAVSALAVATANWEASAVTMQRASDLAASAGAASYVALNDPKKAAWAAGYIAQMNGVESGTTLTWNSATKTLSGGLLTVQVQTGAENSANTAIKVSLAQNRIPLFGSVPRSVSQVTISSSGSREAIAGYTPMAGAWSEGSAGGQVGLVN